MYLIFYAGNFLLRGVVATSKAGIGFLSYVNLPHLRHEIVLEQNS